MKFSTVFIIMTCHLCYYYHYFCSCNWDMLVRVHVLNFSFNVENLFKSIWSIHTIYVRTILIEASV